MIHDDTMILHMFTNVHAHARSYTLRKIHHDGIAHVFRSQ